MMPVVEFSPRFFDCMPFIYQEEGGLSDDPHDPGGRTNKGVTQREFTAILNLWGEPNQDVATITEAQSNTLYWSQYWLPNCALVKPGEDLCLLNFDINAGVTEAIKIIQRTVNVTDDGHFGIITQAACAAAPPAKLIYAFTLKEEAFYRALPAFKYFGSDWIGRSQRCEALALKMAGLQS